jgi:hypothetical protein
MKISIVIASSVLFLAEVSMAQTPTPDEMRIKALSAEIRSGNMDPAVAEEYHDALVRLRDAHLKDPNIPLPKKPTEEMLR